MINTTIQLIVAIESKVMGLQVADNFWSRLNKNFIFIFCITNDNKSLINPVEIRAEKSCL